MIILYDKTTRLMVGTTDGGLQFLDENLGMITKPDFVYPPEGKNYKVLESGDLELVDA